MVTFGSIHFVSRSAEKANVEQIPQMEDPIFGSTIRQIQLQWQEYNYCRVLRNFSVSDHTKNMSTICTETCRGIRRITIRTMSGTCWVPRKEIIEDPQGKLALILQEMFRKLHEEFQKFYFQNQGYLGIIFGPSMKIWMKNVEHFCSIRKPLINCWMNAFTNGITERNSF